MCNKTVCNLKIGVLKKSDER
jgi:hypothetical protein